MRTASGRRGSRKGGVRLLGEAVAPFVGARFEGTPTPFGRGPKP